MVLDLWKQAMNISIVRRAKLQKMHLERFVIQILKLKSLDTILVETSIKRYLILQCAQQVSTCLGHLQWLYV
jgi:hypothetical protein